MSGNFAKHVVLDGTIATFEVLKSQWNALGLLEFLAYKNKQSRPPISSEYSPLFFGNPWFWIGSVTAKEAV
jgi:hypothetical protein